MCDDSVMIEVPRIVVIGTQSSGKSSFLNSILRMNILPTGGQIETRVPLELELFPEYDTENEHKVQFGEYDNKGEWIEQKEIIVRDGEATGVLEARLFITKCTIKKAGKHKGVRDCPIYMRIYSVNVPRLCLVDLPGLTMVACTDQGQSKDIPEQIRTLARKYICSKKSIVCCIISSRTDIETDLGLGFLKNVSCGVERRTMGVLSKLDLMNKGDSITSYLSGEISKDLKLGHGYYAVMNHSPGNTCFVKSHVEREFFESRAYDKKTLSSCGSWNAGLKLSRVLIDAIAKERDNIRKQIQSHLDVVTKELFSLHHIPKSKEQALQRYNTIVHQFCSSYVSIISSSVSVHENTSLRIKETFVDFRTRFTDKNSIPSLTSEEIKVLTDNYNGNHMDCTVCPIVILEKILSEQNIDESPWNVYVSKTRELIDNIQEIILQCFQFCENKKYTKLYPSIYPRIKEKLTSLLFSSSVKVESALIKFIEIEKNYVWTEDARFRKHMNANCSDTVSHVSSLYDMYMNLITQKVSDMIPKYVMYYMINIWKEMEQVLLEECVSNELSPLLIEDSRLSLEKGHELRMKKECLVYMRDILDKKTQV